MSIKKKEKQFDPAEKYHDEGSVFYDTFEEAIKAQKDERSKLKKMIEKARKECAPKKKKELIENIEKGLHQLKEIKKRKLINELDSIVKDLTSAAGEGEALIPENLGHKKKKKKKKINKGMTSRKVSKSIMDNLEEGKKQVTVWDEHGHTYEIDDEGNGKTSTDEGHSHKIKGFLVMSSKGHIHYIPEVQAGIDEEAIKEKNIKKATQLAIDNIKKDLNYYDTPKVEFTTRENGHRHQFWIDQNGDGKTSADIGHSHLVNQFKLDAVNNHIHWLPELQMGIKTELEHTDDLRIAEKIAIDHLREDNHYYSKLREAMILNG